ncbi:MAG: GFA family protein [Pseudomonadales bacterium]|nr:GFA family protein [Pseudomonadales bacterium]MCP5358393.1 GFA family protein [Pseudomonadales bacterium]
MSLHGSCLCGEVRFEIDGDFQNFYLCHCSRCRKDTGSAHAANLFSTTATLIWLSGTRLVKRFELAGTQHARSFCSQCGSALPGEQIHGALLVVPAGSLDDEPALGPEAHLCTASRAGWDRELESLTCFPGLPG